MGYITRVRLSSFLAGVAVTSAAGIFFLYKDYRLSQDVIARQVSGIHETLDARIAALENLKELKSSTVQLELKSSE